MWRQCGAGLWQRSSQFTPKSIQPGSTPPGIARDLLDNAGNSAFVRLNETDNFLARKHSVLHASHSTGAALRGGRAARR
jgi:hypothetical protein